MDSPCHVFVKHSLSDTSFLLTAPFRGMLLTPESVLMMLSPNDVSAPWKSREHYRLYEPFVHSNTELARRTRRYQKFHWTTGFKGKSLTLAPWISVWWSSVSCCVMTPAAARLSPPNPVGGRRRSRIRRISSRAASC